MPKPKTYQCQTCRKFFLGRNVIAERSQFEGYHTGYLCKECVGGFDSYCDCGAALEPTDYYGECKECHLAASTLAAEEHEALDCDPMEDEPWRFPNV